MPTESRPLSPLARRCLFGFLFGFPVLHHVYQVLPRFGSAIAGYDGDNVMNFWTFWHIAQSTLLRGESIYFTTKLLAPSGTFLIYHTAGVLPSMAFAPAAALLGAFAGYNLLLMGGVLMAGLGVWRLTARLSGSSLCGAFAAFAIEMCPSLFWRMTYHFSVLYFGFVPLTLAYFLRALDADAPATSRRRAVTVAALAFAALLTDYNVFIYSVVVMGLAAVALVGVGAIRRDWPALARLGRLTAVAGVVFSVLFYAWACVTPFQDERFWNKAAPMTVANDLSADVAYYALPSPRLWAFRAALPRQVAARAPANQEQANDLGVAVLALTALGFVFLFKRDRPLFCVMALAIFVTFDLSLGVRPLVFGVRHEAGGALGHALLFRIVPKLPLINQSRVPARWALPLLTCVVCVAGCGLRWAMDRSPSRAWRTWVFSIFTGLVFVEFAHVAPPATSYPLPEAYRAMGRASKPMDMILELPVGFISGTGATGKQAVNWRRMVWATRHRYRIVSGGLARLSPQRVRYVINQPLVRDLWMAQGDDPSWLDDPAPTDRASVLRWIKANRLRYIVIDKKATGARSMDYVRGLGVAEPFKEDADYVVLKIDADPARP